MEAIVIDRSGNVFKNVVSIPLGFPSIESFHLPMPGFGPRCCRFISITPGRLTSDRLIAYGWHSTVCQQPDSKKSDAVVNGRVHSQLPPYNSRSVKAALQMGDSPAWQAASSSNAAIHKELPSATSYKPTIGVGLGKLD